MDLVSTGKVYQSFNVISGDIDACKRAADMAEEFGAIKAIPLKVAGAFHTSFMDPAARTLENALKEALIGPASDVKVVANVQ